MNATEAAKTTTRPIQTGRNCCAIWPTIPPPGAKDHAAHDEGHGDHRREQQREPPGQRGVVGRAAGGGGDAAAPAGRADRRERDL